MEASERLLKGIEPVRRRLLVLRLIKTGADPSAKVQPSPERPANAAARISLDHSPISAANSMIQAFSVKAEAPKAGKADATSGQSADDNTPSKAMNRLLAAKNRTRR